MNISKRELEEAIIDRLTITLGQNSKQLGDWFVLNTDNVLKIIEASYYQDRDKYYMEIEGKVTECTPSSYVALVKGRDKTVIEAKILYPTTVEMLTNLNKKDQALTAIVRVMMDYVINYKRVKAVIKRVCMFAKEPYTKHDKQSLVIVYPFALLPTGNIDNKIDNKVIKDYKEHYTQLDEFIEWLVAARFASDRKNAFLYFLASSNWGKGLLFSKILKERLGLVTEITENSLIKINKSEPVGISPESMLHSWVLLINELKNLPDEVKKLENTINLRPLYNDETEANVYAKIFCNASDMNLEAFNSGHGVKDELKTRFSFIEHKTVITDRPLFNNDSEHYVNSLANYVAKEINKQVESYRKLKEAKAIRLANTRLTAFKKRHCIMKKYSGEDWQLLADEFKDWLINNNKIHGWHKDNLFLITQISMNFELFIEAKYAKHQRKYYIKLEDQIVKLASADGKGAKTIRHKSKVLKGFLLKKETEYKVINANF